MQYIDFVKKNIEVETKLLRQLKRIRLPDQEDIYVKKVQRNCVRFFKKDPDTGELHYVSKKDMQQVSKAQMRRFCKVLRERTEHNLKLETAVAEGYLSLDFAEVNKLLPKTYQLADAKTFYDMIRRKKPPFTQSENPYYREGLIHKTSFGLKVRSKGELIIAETLYQAGIEFYYEKAWKLTEEDGFIRTVYPDFQIPLGDGSTLLWEHKGMYGEENYYQRDVRKMQLYHQNGIYQPKNLIVTMDGPDGNMDSMDILFLVQNFIQPKIIDRL